MVESESCLKKNFYFRPGCNSCRAVILVANFLGVELNLESLDAQKEDNKEESVDCIKEEEEINEENEEKIETAEKDDERQETSENDQNEIVAENETNAETGEAIKAESSETEQTESEPIKKVSMEKHL